MPAEVPNNSVALYPKLPDVAQPTFPWSTSTAIKPVSVSMPASNYYFLNFIY